GYRLRQARRRPATRRRAIAWAAGTALGLALAGLGVGLGIWLSASAGTGDPEAQQTLRFHASAALTDPGDVSGADCSQDLVIANARSVGELTGEFAGRMEVMSTTRLYPGTH